MAVAVGKKTCPPPTSSWPRRKTDLPKEVRSNKIMSVRMPKNRELRVKSNSGLEANKNKLKKHNKFWKFRLKDRDCKIKST